MDAEEINQPIASQSEEPIETPTETADTAQTDRPLNRRRFLTAAVLGTAAAALLNKGSGGKLRLGPASAFAHDLSTSQCTANDVRIIGPGKILNEPCNCSGSFTAQVEFTVENNAASDRGCIILHLIPVTLPNGTIFDPGDITLNNGLPVPGKTTVKLTASIPNYPCGAGLICFGSPSADGRSRCAAGECATVSWTVPGQDSCPPTRFISSKCRHQQICIQGRGATLTCIDNCTPDCGGTAKLRLCVSGGVAPFTYALSDGQTFGPTNDTCHDFNVTVTSTTTFTGTITDSGTPPCAQSSNPVTINASPVAAPTLSRTGPDCDGKVTIAVTNCDAGLTYTFKEGSTTLPSSGCSLTNHTFAPGSHTVTVTASNAGGTCTAQASISFTVNQPVAASLSAPSAGCNGVVTMTVTASGGTGSYTFAASAGTLSGSGSTRTLTLQPQLDGSCRTVTVTVTDGAGCAASSNARSFSQCVTTTAC